MRAIEKVGNMYKSKKNGIGTKNPRIIESMISGMQYVVECNNCWNAIILRVQRDRGVFQVILRR
jgi:hypothetical protein